MSDSLERVAGLVERENGIQVRESLAAALAAALGRVSRGMDADGFLGALDDPAQRSALTCRLIDQVAMLATEAFGHGRPPVAILATDISMRAFRRAEEAAYSERSTCDLSPARRDRFLVREGARSVVSEQLRFLVRLRRHNLVADPAPPPARWPLTSSEAKPAAPAPARRPVRRAAAGRVRSPRSGQRGEYTARDRIRRPDPRRGPARRRGVLRARPERACDR